MERMMMQKIIIDEYLMDIPAIEMVAYRPVGPRCNHLHGRAEKQRDHRKYLGVRLDEDAYYKKYMVQRKDKMIDQLFMDEINDVLDIVDNIVEEDTVLDMGMAMQVLDAIIMAESIGGSALKSAADKIIAEGPQAYPDINDEMPLKQIDSLCDQYWIIEGARDLILRAA